MADNAQVEHECKLLQEVIARLGTRDSSTGKVTISFGLLYRETQDTFEALAGTMKAAKKRGIIQYSAPILLSPTHDKEVITLLIE